MNREDLPEVERAQIYLNTGYSPEGLFQREDESGYIILRHTETDEEVQVDLPTARDIDKIASEYGLDVQKEEFL